MQSAQRYQTIAQGMADSGYKGAILKRHCGRIAYCGKTDSGYRGKYCIFNYCNQNLHSQKTFMFIVRKPNVSPAAMHPVSMTACIMRLKKHR